MVGARGFEPPASWSRTIEVKQSNALNRRRIAVQLPPLFGLLSGLRCLSLDRRHFHRRCEGWDSQLFAGGLFCFLFLYIDLSSAWGSTRILIVLDPRKSVINTLREDISQKLVFPIAFEFPKRFDRVTLEHSAVNGMALYTYLADPASHKGFQGPILLLDLVPSLVPNRKAC
jgi:hypothetical protein